MKIHRGARVKIKYTGHYAEKEKFIGKYGVVETTYYSPFMKYVEYPIGVLVDDERNANSIYGVYWFREDELEIIDNESEETVMENYKYVAIVNLLEDSYKRDYAFAMYDNEFEMACHIEEQNSPAMVVVNARAKDNRMLGTIKNVMLVEDYKKENKNTKITAEVVGVVNMNGYIAREEEKARQKELAKKKAAIERELEAEINKRKSVEYYEEMAQKYSDNPKLAELVAELKCLGN